jgi:hypothetical protein
MNEPQSEEPQFDSNSELSSQLQSLKQHPGFQWYMERIKEFETQANEDVMLKRNIGKEDEDRGEWIAYRRAGKLIDQTLAELRAKPPVTDVSDFDGFK